MSRQESRVDKDDDRLVYVSRSAVMFCIIILAVIAGYIGFGLGFLVAELLKCSKS